MTERKLTKSDFEITWANQAECNELPDEYVYVVRTGIPKRMELSDKQRKELEEKILNSGLTIPESECKHPVYVVHGTTAHCNKCNTTWAVET